MYFYFKVDDSCKCARSMNATARVEYPDAEPELLGIEFDRADLAVPQQGAYSGMKKIEPKGDRKWKTATFKLCHVFFTGAQNGGADFRLVAEAPEFAVRKVPLQRD